MTKIAAGVGNNGQAKSNSPPCLCKERRDKDGAPSYLIVYACACQRQSCCGACTVRDRQCRVVGEDVGRGERDLEGAGLLHGKSGGIVVAEQSIGTRR